MPSWPTTILHLLYPPLCRICGERVSSGKPLCVRCRLKVGAFSGRDSVPPVPLRSLIWLGRHQGELRRLIHDIKLGASHRLAVLLGEELGHLLRRHGEGSPQLLLPIPCSGTSRLRRGFDQAERIAQGVSRILKVPLAADLLVRSRPTRYQKRLKKAERVRNVHGAYRLARPVHLQGKDVLVIDDVATTGATLSEVGRLLVREGARRVGGAVLARTEAHGENLGGLLPWTGEVH